jgi:hypothetical protein
MRIGQSQENKQSPELDKNPFALFPNLSENIVLLFKIIL